ncbi:MAG TPA: uroporphyrinogen decarboxylase family protein [Saprospiraceae bacterium]|nr:uroporphyrinogen decarboxylase family protein [Saprospiraceae bacterium]HNT20506.1 uroporphyrinogen decarboxylase family protein [Saprospiraceae bacterium]
MKRSQFLRTSLMGTGALLAGSPLLSSLASCKQTSTLSNRDRMLQWLEGKTEPGYTPAAFFLHFGDDFKLGSAAAQEHLRYFRHTGMDFVKIQYEQQYPLLDFLKTPADWSKLRPNPVEFYQPQLQAVKEIVQASKKEALVIMTLYSPFMWAGHSATREVLLKHMEEDPEAVKKGLDILTESQLIFVRACIDLGVDGFYMSTQGSETGQFSDPRLFTEYVKPSDLVAMKEVTAACPFNILHVCDYNAPYASYDAVLDYPGQVVNCNPQLTGRLLTWQEISEMFNRPCMGGMDRHGVIGKGSRTEIENEVRNVLKQVPDQFILGADCTVPGDTDWDRLKAAISVAHGV